MLLIFGWSPLTTWSRGFVITRALFLVFTLTKFSGDKFSNIRQHNLFRFSLFSMQSPLMRKVVSKKSSHMLTDLTKPRIEGKDKKEEMRDKIKTL